MGTIHYVGDSIDLSFEIVITPANAPALQSITVSVFSDEGEIIHEDPLTLVDNMVSYTISPEMTRHAGNYAAMFTVKLANNMVKTHRMLFAVLPRGAPEEGKELDVAQLDENANEDTVNKAISSSLRKSRRANKGAGDAIDTVYETAQKKAQRYIPR